MRQLIIARKDLNMSPGKLAAQVSHASMAFLSNMIRHGGLQKRASLDTGEMERYEIMITMDPAIYDDWLCDIFTKTICEAKNRNQLMKAVALAEAEGLVESRDFFLIRDNCLTELEPEEIGEDGNKSYTHARSGWTHFKICKSIDDLGYLFLALIQFLLYSVFRRAQKSLQKEKEHYKMDIAVITGASSGLGKVFAEKVCAKYPNLDEVWLIARRKERLEQFAQEHPTVKIRPIALDLSLDSSYEELAVILAEESPNIRVFINNAGFNKMDRFDQAKKSDRQT